MAKSTKNGSDGKPSKPYSGFPLFAHANGQWTKKIRGKHRHFGKWADPEGALQRCLDQKDYLHAGQTPRIQAEGLTVADLASRFLTAKRHLLDTREITNRTFVEYHRTCKILVKAFGRTRLVDDLSSDDFKLLRERFRR